MSKELKYNGSVTTTKVTKDEDGNTISKSENVDIKWISSMTKEDILELRPTFYLKNNPMSMVEWFEIHEGPFWCTISSGLRHADGVTKSPYHYEDHGSGENATFECVKNFNEWWNKREIML